MAKRRRKKSAFGSTERYTVVGPPRWRRSVHTSKSAAIDAGHACSKQFPNAVCRVEHGLPGMQRTIAECNRNECYQVSGIGRRRRKARR
jgi:hypothetical protein